MKLTKLMLSASLAAFALVSCNKEEATPQVASRLKTVEISLENFTLTKGEAGNKIKSGDAVIVNDFKIFLTDASGNEYTAKVEDGSADAKTYWAAEELAGGLPTAAASFHYVDPNCTKVIAVANLGDDLTFAEYKQLANLEIGNQQKQDNLVLYDEATLTAAGKQHNDTNADGGVYVSDVYEAKITLTPRVSRFEVDGFAVKFADDPKYNEINITQIAFQNYYPETSVITGEESGALVNHIADLSNQAEVYSWLDTPQDPNPWYRDNFDLTITPTDTEADTPKPLAYHMFSCDKAPVMVIKLLADGQPAYLYTKGFYKDAQTPVENFEEGKIYRMSAAGDVLGDGSIFIDEDDIDPMDRCLEIIVEVVDWAVELVYPEF
jgi:hypothetical protein